MNKEILEQKEYKLRIAVENCNGWDGYYNHLFYLLEEMKKYTTLFKVVTVYGGNNSRLELDLKNDGYYDKTIELGEIVDENEFYKIAKEVLNKDEDYIEIRDYSYNLIKEYYNIISNYIFKNRNSNKNDSLEISREENSELYNYLEKLVEIIEYSNLLDIFGKRVGEDLIGYIQDFLNEKTDYEIGDNIVIYLDSFDDLGNIVNKKEEFIKNFEDYIIDKIWENYSDFKVYEVKDHMWEVQDINNDSIINSIINKISELVYIDEDFSAIGYSQGDSEGLLIAYMLKDKMEVVDRYEGNKTIYKTIEGEEIQKEFEEYLEIFRKEFAHLYTYEQFEEILLNVDYTKVKVEKGIDKYLIVSDIVTKDFENYIKIETNLDFEEIKEEIIENNLGDLEFTGEYYDEDEFYEKKDDFDYIQECDY